MSRVVLLDAGPLGLLANPDPGPRARDCQAWAIRLRRLGVTFYVPALADFEVRRGLKLAGQPLSVQALDALIAVYGYLPPSAEAIELASDLWADARRHGHSIGPDRDLQADIILAAQAHELSLAGIDAWVASDNLRHLNRLYSRCALWEDIGPG